MQSTLLNSTSQPAKQPWQLQMFRRSLKKQLKLEALLKMTGDVSGKKCLLITCGDNTGALNWHFRAHGGDWSWADVTAENLGEMEAFLGEPVQQITVGQFAFAADQFDCVVAIDVLEHLPDDQPFLRELDRILKSTGQAVVTVPNGDPHLLANRIKWQLGMTPEVYGHTRAGYTIAQLQTSLRQAGLNPMNSGGYSRFFTEMLELAINFGYVFVLSRKQQNEGQIAPTSAGELKTHGLAYRLYGLAYPLMRLISNLDRLLPASTNNAVIVTAKKSGGVA